MLVLTRKLGERLVIAESIEITVVQIRGNKVRLGVTAPDQVSIRRLEVENRIKAAFGGSDRNFEVHDKLDVASPRLTTG